MLHDVADNDSRIKIITHKYAKYVNLFQERIITMIALLHIL